MSLEVIKPENLMLNCKPRTIFCRDNLDILTNLNSSCIDLIYLDPPFNKNKTFTAPIGSSAEGAGFKDIFREEDVNDEWVKSIEFESAELHHYLSAVRWFSSRYNYCYLVYMAIRLIECKRVLKDSGSLYLHCDPTMSHYLKIVLDTIFGEKNFQNEIIWGYKSGGASKKRWARKHDVLFYYSKNNKMVYFQSLKEKSYNRGLKPYRFKGVQEYQDETGWHTLVNMKDIWHIAMVGRTAKDRTQYPTQKPIALLERIIEASTRKGEVVLDPFCGCATTCVAAEKLEREWIGIDVGISAFEMVQQRLERAVLPVFKGKPNFSTTPPIPSDKEDRESGYVYVISNPAYPNEFKVGIARDVKQRLNSYQTSDPNRRYKVEHQLLTPLYKEIERHIHDTFPNRYEWVQASRDKIIAAIQNYNAR